jgi:hypothetical protein
MERQAFTTIQQWPEESREAAQLVLDKYGEPDEITPTVLTWQNAGPWKRIVATREFFEHAFPAPHIDAVESFIDYRVPPEMLTPLAEFDGSIVVERTAGEVSARCHDEEANTLALNLMHDIVRGEKTVQQAREYYKKEFLDYRRGLPTPYMDRLRFAPQGERAADPDRPIITERELEVASNR